MKRKTLSLALALALCLGLTLPALAAEYPQVTWLPAGLQGERNQEIDELDSCANGVVIVCNGIPGGLGCGKHGLADRTGKLITPIEYDYFISVSDELICGYKGRKSYLVNITTGAAMPLDYHLTGGESEGLIQAYSIQVEPNDHVYKYGFVDTTGRIVIPLIYDSVSPFSEGLAQVCNNKWGNAEYAFVDRSGKTVIDLGTTYKAVESFSEGLAVVYGYDGKAGAIDQSGQLVIPLEYDWIHDFSGGLAAAGKITGTDALGNPAYTVGFIDRTGTAVIPFEYDNAFGFSDGLAAVAIRSGYAMDEFLGEYAPTYKYGFVDATGKVVIPLVYDWVGFNWGNTNKVFNGGAAAVCKDNKWGLIDQSGNIIVSLEYDNIESPYINYFSNGVVQFQKGNWETGKTYVMDASGALAIPPEYGWQWRSPKYGEPGVFFDGVAAVSKGGKWGYMDRSGRILLPLEYDEVSYASDGVGVVRQGSRYGIVNLRAATASPTNDKLTVDGVPANPTVYKIGGSNYFKIRDVAALLNGTGKQFSVGYDGEKKSVTATTGEGYTKLDTDLLGAPSGGNQTAGPSNDAVYINGQKADAEVYKINGGNYFKLRDLGRALNFYVGWTKEDGMFIDTAKPYSE